MFAYHDTESDRMNRESKMREIREKFEALKVLRTMRDQANGGQQIVATSQMLATHWSSGGPPVILNSTLAWKEQAELLQKQIVQTIPVRDSDIEARTLRERLGNLRRSPPAMLDSEVDWDVRARLVLEEVERLTRNTATQATGLVEFMPTSKSRSSSSSSQTTEPPPYSTLDMNTAAQFESSGNLLPLSPIQQLQKLETKHPNKIICPACVKFHPIHGRFARSCHRLLNALPLISSWLMSCSAYKCNLNCGYSINLMTLHLVMRAHRLGPRYGLPVSALFRSDSYTNSKCISDYKAILTSQSTACIVENRLILRITTRFRLTQTLNDQIGFPQPTDPKSYECEEFVRPVVCPHVSTEDSWIGDVMKDFVNSQDTISSLQDIVLSMQSCRHCSSQYEILDRRRRNGERSTIKGKDRVFQIDRYIDFGECFPDDTTEWNAVTKKGTGLDYTRMTSPIGLWRRP